MELRLSRGLLDIGNIVLRMRCVANDLTVLMNNYGTDWWVELKEGVREMTVMLKVMEGYLEEGRSGVEGGTQQKQQTKGTRERFQQTEWLAWVEWGTMQQSESKIENETQRKEEVIEWNKMEP